MASILCATPLRDKNPATKRQLSGKDEPAPRVTCSRRTNTQRYLCTRPGGTCLSEHDGRLLPKRERTSPNPSLFPGNLF